MRVYLYVGGSSFIWRILLGGLVLPDQRMHMYYARINIKGVLCFIAISQQNTKSADFFVTSKIHVPLPYGFAL